MIRKFFFAAACALFSVLELFSQSDSTRYINGLPVSEDDTVQNFLPHDAEPKNERVAVALAALPADLLRSLEKEGLYSGWKDTAVFYDRNTGLYLIHVKKGESLKIFGLNKNGKPVTYDEVSRRRE